MRIPANGETLPASTSNNTLTEYWGILLSSVIIPFVGRLLVSRVKTPFHSAIKRAAGAKAPIEPKHNAIDVALLGMASKWDGDREEGKTYTALFQGTQQLTELGFALAPLMPLTVCRVWQGGAAEQQGIRKGDVIETINGEDVRRGEFDHAVQKLREHASRVDDQCKIELLAAQIVDLEIDHHVRGYPLHTGALRYLYRRAKARRRQQSWNVALKWLGWDRTKAGERVAKCLAAFRLVFWHLLQPISYGIVLYAYWADIDALQQKLAVVVAVREASYAALALYATLKFPAFLLVDLTVNLKQTLVLDTAYTNTRPAFKRWQEGGESVLMYGLMPEKWLLTLLNAVSPNVWLSAGYTYRCFMMALIVADMCGAAALVVGAAGKEHATLPHALAIGYSVVLISGVYFLVHLVWTSCACLVRSIYGTPGNCSICYKPRRCFRWRVHNPYHLCCSTETPAFRSTVCAWEDPRSFVYTRHDARRHYPTVCERESQVQHAAKHSIQRWSRVEYFPGRWELRAKGDVERNWAYGDYYEWAWIRRDRASFRIVDFSHGHWCLHTGGAAAVDEAMVRAEAPQGMDDGEKAAAMVRAEAAQGMLHNEELFGVEDSSEAMAGKTKARLHTAEPVKLNAAKAPASGCCSVS